jgi:hypothetical protein
MARVPTIAEEDASVYRSPTTRDLILANWQHGSQPAGTKAPAPIDGSRLGTSVESEFEHAVTVAYQEGVPFVWVDDPNGLFPPSARPSISVRGRP